MWSRVLDLILLTATIVGGFLAWQTGRERARLGAQYERLARVAGDLQVPDPSKVTMLVIETGDPMQFAWRVYLPPNSKIILRERSGGFSSMSSSAAGEFIARVRFREDEEGDLQVYTHFANGSSRMNFGNKALARLLRGRWDKVHVEQFGAAGLAAVRTDRPAVLLRMTMPGDMQEEARKTLAPDAVARFVPVFYGLELGPETAKP